MADEQPRGYLPKQRRSERTRARLVEAGKRLFSEEGYHRTSSKKIAREAGVATGSFYNHFRDKKQLLLELNRLYMASIHARVAELLAQADFGAPASDGRTVVREIIRQAVALHNLSPELHREISALTYTDEEFGELGRQEHQRSVDLLLARLQPHAHTLRVRDLPAAAKVVVQAMEAVIHSVRFFPGGEDEERLLDALGDMVFRYLYED